MCLLYWAPPDVSTQIDPDKYVNVIRKIDFEQSVLGCDQWRKIFTGEPWASKTLTHLDLERFTEIKLVKKIKTYKINKEYEQTLLSDTSNQILSLLLYINLLHSSVDHQKSLSKSTVSC